MRLSRQNKILELIEQNEIETQDKLASMLREYGYDVTQATVSRDIKELQLVKILLHLALSSFLQDDADEYGFLGLVLAHTFITLQTWKYVL